MTCTRHSPSQPHPRREHSMVRRETSDRAKILAAMMAKPEPEPEDYELERARAQENRTSTRAKARAKARAETATKREARRPACRVSGVRLRDARRV